MNRTTGNEDTTNFRLTGLSTAIKLVETMNALGRGLTSAQNVLDWGCGCGRVARFCLEWPGFTGVDIDADNIGWCRAHLHPERFEEIGLYPPTPLARGHFDVIFGISVMTHLDEDVQQEWLKELYEISAPDAVVLLTIIGEHGASRARFTAENFAEYLASGKVFVRTPEVIDDALGSPGYYGTTFLTHDYVRRKWSRWFKVERIIPSYIGNHLDLVVLRRR
jgi:cyclopropane fatty-acyl-phospholipid synthase-like methyltransferase